MPDAERPLLGEPYAGIADWWTLVQATLKRGDLGALTTLTRDGIRVEPLCERRGDTKPLAGRGSPRWSVVQPIDDPDLDRANAQAADDLAGGATGLSLRFAGARSAAGRGLPLKPDALAAALDGIDLAIVHLRLEPHPGMFRTAMQLSVLVEESGVAPELAEISFGLDPLALWNLPDAPDPAQFAGTLSYLRSAHFRGPIACLDARVFHEAGASEAQELASLLAAGAWWVRALKETEVGAPTDIASHFSAALSVDRDVLMSLAKLRALRLLWARFQELCGAPRSPLPIHAETSRRMLTRADPHTNLLRNTLAAFAAGAGGADSILVQPHSAALGAADSESRALARNIQHLLLEESRLGFVRDPVAGSGTLEALTDALAEHAWAEFQEIEREGGIIESLRAERFQARIATARAALVESVTSGAAPLVGVTVHRAPDAAPAVTPANAPAAKDSLAPISLEASVKEAA